MDIVLNRSSLEVKEKTTFVGTGAIAAARADKVDEILQSKSRFIVSRMHLHKGLRLEKEMGFSSLHKMICRAEIFSNQISQVFWKLFNIKSLENLP